MFSSFVYMIFANTSEKTAGNILDHITQIHFQKTSQFFKKGHSRNKSLYTHEYLIYSGTFDIEKV